MTSYDRAITVFSPEGNLLQVQYAQQAVRMGSSVVGVRGPNVVVLAAEKKLITKLQLERIERKIVALDTHLALAYAGLKADARVIIHRSQMECQSYRLSVEDIATVEYISKYIAGMKQKYTQSTGRRPFGISCLIAGYDEDGTPHLYQTDPSGMYYEWKAASIGRCIYAIRDFLETHYNDEIVSTDEGAVKLALRALQDFVQKGNGIEAAILKRGEPMLMLCTDAINCLLQEIAKEKESGDCEKM